MGPSRTAAQPLCGPGHTVGGLLVGLWTHRRLDTGHCRKRELEDSLSMRQGHRGKTHNGRFQDLVEEHKAGLELNGDSFSSEGWKFSGGGQWRWERPSATTG